MYVTISNIAWTWYYILYEHVTISDMEWKWTDIKYWILGSGLKWSDVWY